MLQPDVTELLDFYDRPLGAVVRRILAQNIRSRWPRITGATLIGLGFATPYLGSFRGEVARLGAFMPAAQGATVWPQVGPVTSVAVEEHQLPLPDNTVDNLLAVHCLETSENGRLLLREIWRVMKPEGRLLLVVPNRRGVWARLDTTPFGHGRPYSSGQLERLLAEALFTPIDWGAALFMPPFDRRMVLRSAPTLERFGRRVSPAFAGVIVVEARKELIAPLVEPSKARRLESLVPLRGAAAARRDAGDDRDHASPPASGVRRETALIVRQSSHDPRTLSQAFSNMSRHVGWKPRQSAAVRPSIAQLAGIRARGW